VTSGYIPNGVQFRASDGHLVGTPREGGFFPFTASFSDSLGVQGSGTFRWNVAGGPPPVTHIVANPYLTPGVINPNVTQSTIQRTICVAGWTRKASPSAAYTSKLKSTQMHGYEESGPPSRYEEDHLIPLELGGAARNPQNLWPEPRPRADSVDKIEVALARQVCGGAISLAEARRKISTIKETRG